jgi:hypothetical protein
VGGVAWPAVPEDLLAGPRGRRTCFEIVSPYRDDGSLPSGPGWHDLPYGSDEADARQLAAELAELVAAADLAAIVATDADTGLIGCVQGAVGNAMYWQPPDECDLALAQEQVAQTLAPVARAVTAASASTWWSSPLDRDRQQYVQFLEQEPGMDMDPPALTGAAANLAAWLAHTGKYERDAADLPADPAANYSGEWWSAPVHSALVRTTRSLSGLAAVRLLLVEDSMGWTQARCWPLRPHPDATVYEIRGPADWAELVARYPLDVSTSRRHDWWRVTRRAGGWLIPDFAAVAADFDAVHVTVGGYLTTAGRALPVPGRDDAYATMLAGWDPDQTFWLADVLEPAGPVVRWENPEGEPLGWIPASDTIAG